MARRIHVIEVPRDATMPAENISGPEWSAAQSQIANASTQAEMANTRVFDVRAYGNIGTADDSAVIQAAIDAASVGGGGVVTMPPGLYTFLSGIRLKHGVTIAGSGRASCIFDMTGVTPANGVTADSGTSCSILAEGSLTALPNLGSNVGLHSRTVTFASAPDLAPGDWFCIYNTVDGSFSSERVYYRDGEWCQVKSVAGNVVTLTKATYSSYVVANCTNHKMAPLVGGMSGITVRFNTGITGASIRKSTGFEINDCEFFGTNRDNLSFSQSVNIGLHNVRAWSNAATDSSTTNYGLMLGNCQHVTVVSPFLESERHGFTTGGGTGPGCVPNRDILILGGTINTNGSTVPGADCHGNTEFITWQNVSMPGGIHIAGDRIRVSKCDIWASPTGVAVWGTRLIGYDIELDDNTYRGSGVIHNDGLIQLHFTGEVIRGGHLRVSGELSVRSLRAPSGATYGLNVNATSTDVHGDITADLTGRATNVTIGEEIWGIHIRAAGTANYHSRVIAKAKFTGMGIRIQDSQYVSVEGSDILLPPRQGILVNNPHTSYTIRTRGNNVRGAGRSGIQLAGTAKADGGLITMHGDEVINCNTSESISSSAGANVFVGATSDVSMRDMILGTTQTTPTPTRTHAVTNVSKLHLSPITNIGSLTAYATGLDTTVNV